MNLKHLSSERLIIELKTLVATERRVGVAILHHLREVEERRLYLSQYQCPSLFAFAVRVLGYSSDAAWRRITAMRALKELPSLQEKIESGALSLTVVARATQFFKEEGAQRKEVGLQSMSAPEKLAVFASLEGKSTRQAEAVFSAQSSKPIAIKTLKVELHAEDYANLEKLQGLLSHRDQGRAGTLAGVLAVLIEEGLEKHDPVRIEARSERRRLASLLGPPQAVNTAAVQKAVSPAPSARHLYECPTEGRDSFTIPNSDGASPSSRHIPAIIKRRVWLRDRGTCTQPGCGATKFLHYDHVQPFFMGGGHSAQNLRLLCSVHHSVVTRDVFGKWPT